MAVSLWQVSQLEQFNNGIVGRLLRQLADVRGSLFGVAPELVRDELLSLAPALADQYGQLIMAGAAEWYEQVRAAELSGRYSARLGAAPDSLAVERNVRFAADQLFTENPGLAFELLGAALERHVIGSSRDTIMTNTEHDPKSVGWHRIARSGGCDFCVMLSQRGAVYTRRGVDFAAHDNCHCRVAPSWDPKAPEVDVRAYEMSKSTAKMSDRQKAAHDKRLRDWMDAHKDSIESFRAELQD